MVERTNLNGKCKGVPKQLTDLLLSSLVWDVPTLSYVCLLAFCSCLTGVIRSKIKTGKCNQSKQIQVCKINVIK